MARKLKLQQKPIIKPHVAKAILKSMIKNPANSSIKTTTKTIIKEYSICSNCDKEYEMPSDDVYTCDLCKEDYCTSCATRNSKYDIIDMLDLRNDSAGIYDNVPWELENNKKFIDSTTVICEFCCDDITYKKFNVKLTKISSEINNLSDKINDLRDKVEANKLKLCKEIIKYIDDKSKKK